MSNINLRVLIGMKVRVISSNGKGERVGTKQGVITEATRNLIVVKHNNYCESFNLGTILASTSTQIEIRSGKEWISLRRTLLN